VSSETFSILFSGETFVVAVRVAGFFGSLVVAFADGLADVFAISMYLLLNLQESYGRGEPITRIRTTLFTQPSENGAKRTKQNDRSEVESAIEANEIEFPRRPFTKSV
jgi:hypothetical protein